MMGGASIGSGSTIELGHLRVGSKVSECGCGGQVVMTLTCVADRRVGAAGCVADAEESEAF